MVDPISAFGMATAAFNAIKKGFEVGRDVESMYGDIGRWMTSCETVNKEAKKAKTSGMSCLLYTSPSPRDISGSRMPSSA